MNNNFDPVALSRMITDDRIRETSRLRLAKECRRSEPATGRAATPSERHSRLWTLVHLRQAFS
jgi:hypothetical protein